MEHSTPQPSLLIVGAGPVGLVLANALAQQRIKFTIIDKSPYQSVHSKALSVNAATLKSLHNLGIAKDIIARGKKMHDVFIYFNQHRVTHINKRFLDSPYNCFVTIPQPETEATLEQALNNHGINVIRNIKLTSIKTLTNQKTVVTLDNQSTNTTHDEFYDYVVACDGANSTVRTLLDIPWHGKDYHLKFIVADTDIKTTLNSTSLHYFVFDGGFIIILPMQGKYTRIVINDSRLNNINDLNNTNSMTSYLNKNLPGDCSIEQLLWFSTANIYNRIASTNKIGNVILAGDAFHLFSPIGGMGMNTGIQDAFNLAWKLTHCIKNKAKPCLLDTYATERMEKAKAITDITDLNTEIITGHTTYKEAHRIYFPNLNKRKYIKKLFPYIFSGFITDHTDELYANKHFPIIAGGHAPFIRFKQEKHAVKNSYELSATNKYCLILGNKDAQIKIEKIIRLYSDIVFYSIPRKK